MRSSTTSDLKYHVCYRLGLAADLDEEVVWAFVQRHGGWLSIRQECIDFWIHEDWASLLVLAWPALIRVPALDYVA